jgi:hypothetical protein
MSIPAYLKPENGALGRAFGTWLDQAPQGVANRFVLLWFVILYTAFAIISSGTLGLSPELLETYALGQHAAAGYAGHAPLAPWLAGIWFRAFPPTDWAFHLLAMVNAAVGLFAADRIARLYLDGDKVIAALLLLLLTPFYQFFGQRFGATETMLSTWPVATWCFLRAFATRDLAWSAAAGVTAALAVLGNYASLFLIFGFIVAMLAHRERRAFLRSWAPWLALAIGAVVLAPHLQWLYITGPTALGDAASAAPPLADALRDNTTAIAASVAAVGAALAVWWLAVRPNHAILRDTLWPTDQDGRTLLIVLAVPLVLQFLAAPILAASFVGRVLPLSWSLASTWFLLPVILLRPKTAVLTRTSAIRITALVAVATIGTLAAAPWLASRQQGEATSEGRAYYRLVGTEVTKAWRLATGRPLRIVMGDPRLTAAAAFYSADHPDAVPGFETGSTPWVTPARLSADGFAAICKAEDETCVDAAKQKTAGKANTQFITYSTVSREAGQPARLERFFFILTPPAGAALIGMQQLPRFDVMNMPAFS